MYPARVFRVISRYLRALFYREKMDEELEDEIAFHFEQLVRENVEAGMPLGEARQAARRKFGNTAIFAEDCRSYRGTGWIHDFVQDIRYGARLLRNSPLFTAVVISSVALGIGANTAILAAMGRILGGDLLFPEAGRLFVIRTVSIDDAQKTDNASVPDYLEWKKRSRSFESLGISLTQQRDFGPKDDGTSAERYIGQAFSPSLFQALGVKPAIGRVFSDAEAQPGKAARVVVLSDRLWRRRFGGDPGILNGPVQLNGQSVNVIGVMPPGFNYPVQSDFWIPLAVSPAQAQRSARYFIVTGRLKPGVTVKQAQLELDSIAAQVEKEMPGRLDGWGGRLVGLTEYWFGWARGPLLTLEGAVIVVMLIACANVATLLLARGASRRQEMSMRIALGAGRIRLIRQLLAESTLLSLLGGAAGLAVAALCLKALPQLVPPPGRLSLVPGGLNLTLLSATFLLSILTGLAFGAGPAFSAFAFNHPMRKAGRRKMLPDRRDVLVAGQISLALVLLIVAALLLKSSLQVRVTERNFDPRGILTFEFRLPLGEYLKNVGVYRGSSVMEVAPPSKTMQRIFEKLRVTFGPESVAGISVPPVNSVIVPQMDVGTDGKSFTNAAYFVITPNFFKTMSTPFVGGRDIDEQDTASASWKAIVNETAARRFWPGEDAIGKWIRLDADIGEQARQVVGIVRNIPLRYFETSDEPVIYTSYLQQGERYRGPFANMFGQMVFLIRTSGDPLRLVPAARDALAEVKPETPLSNAQAMGRSIGSVVRDHDLYTVALSIFAFTAVALAVIGVYGVSAYSVAQRTHEIGIRMALGAGVRSIVFLIGRRAMAMITSGLAAGILVASVATRFIAFQLWRVSPTDASVFAAVSVLLALVVVLACLIPARRAIRINPTEALRAE